METRQKHRFLSACLCLITLVLTGCSLFGGGGQPVKASTDKQILTDPQTGIADFTTLDPALASDPNSIQAIQMMFTGLVQLDDHQQVRPQLAQSWQQSSDGLTYTFHLRKNLKFNDGTPLTANDVIYSLDRALQPKTKSTIAPIYLSLIKDADKLLSGKIDTLIGNSLLASDPQTVSINLSKKVAYFLPMLTYPCSYVVEKSFIGTYGNAFTDHLAQGGGAGPFKVQSYEHSRQIVFVPNPAYYGSKPQLLKVIIPFYQQVDSAYQAYQNGQVDISTIPVSKISAAKKHNDFHQVPQLWENYYTMNYLVKPFDNINIRQAFALAIDKEDIAQTVWQNSLQPTNHILPQNMPGYNGSLTGPDGSPGLKGNPTRARQILQQGLKEEGWNSINEMPPIRLSYVTGISNFDREARALQQMWQKNIGVRIELNPLDYSTLLDQVTASANNPNGLQFWGLAWIAEYPDPQDWLTVQFGNKAMNNSMNYGQNTSNNAAKQQIIQQQLNNADGDLQADTRIKAYQQAEQALINDVAWIPMQQVTSNFVRKPYVIGMTENAQNQIPPDDWANIYITQH